MSSSSAQSPHQQVRQLLCRALAGPACLLQMPPKDLDLTLRVARRSRLLGRLAFQLEARGLLGDFTPVVADQLQSALVHAQAEARTALWELDRIAWALSGMDDIPVIALKGCAYLLAGTPNAGGRTFADVDLLVPEERLAEVERRLLQRGWRSKELSDYDQHYYRAWAHELPPLRHVERGTELDLHHNILMRTARLKPSAALLFEAAQEVPGSRFRVLAPVDMVLHAMVHLFEGGELVDSIRELVDIDDLLRHFGTMESDFGSRFWPRAEALDLVRPAFYGLRYARRLLGASGSKSVTGAASAGRPPMQACRIMDRCVPPAMWPQSPEKADWLAVMARQMMRARSHWLKMPPGQLIQHLGYKSYQRVRGSH